jgi:hypothetical protein
MSHVPCLKKIMETESEAGKGVTNSTEKRRKQVRNQKNIQ